MEQVGENAPELIWALARSPGPRSAAEPKRLTGQINNFHQAVHNATDPNGNHTARTAAQTALHEILAWLWDTTAGPVLDALRLSQSLPPGTGGAQPIGVAGRHALDLQARDRLRRQAG